MKIWRFAVLAAHVALLRAQQPMTFQYFYDEIGQLVKVVDSTGIVIEYVYDEVGNMLEIKRSTVASGALSIFSLSPQRGATGTRVTILGQGFSTVASANTVRFGALTATVVSASATQLVVVVPGGVATGPVTVTVNGVTAASSAPFVNVPVPVISAIRPTGALPGTTVSFQVTGFNLTASTFAFLPLFQPPHISVANVVVNPAGTQATMNITLLSAGLLEQYVVTGTNAAGASDPFPNAGNALRIYFLTPDSDPDQDGLTSAEELLRGTDPTKFDTDGDGFGDGLELALGSDPLNPASRPNLTAGPRESVGRTVSVLNSTPPPLPASSTFRESVGRTVSVLNSTPPPLPASSTYRESVGRTVSVLNSTRPPLPASSTYRESIGALVSVANQAAGAMSRGVLPTAGFVVPGGPLGPAEAGPDSDGDGIPDQYERAMLTDPGRADTDGDGYPDGLEVALKSDPTDPASQPKIQWPPEVVSPVVSVRNDPAAAPPARAAGRVPRRRIP